MGVPMIKNLLKSKNKISIFNRTIKKAQKLSKYGAIVSLSIDQLVKDKDVIITMLTDDKAVNQIISSKKFQQNINKKTTVIDMSSTKPITALNNYKIKRIKVDFYKRISGVSKWNTNFNSKLIFILRTIKFSLKLKFNRYTMNNWK